MSMMIPDMISGAAPPLTATAGVKAAPEVQQPEAEAFPHSRAPVMDEYIPEEKQEPSGRYWLGKDEDGKPKIYFDDPERADDGPSDAPSPAKRAAGDKAERCTGSTDQVDREIERLRRRKETLEQEIRSQADDAKIKELERKLAQVERELAQKDNDAYRRQHTVFS